MRSFIVHLVNASDSRLVNVQFSGDLAEVALTIASFLPVSLPTFASMPALSCWGATRDVVERPSKRDLPEVFGDASSIECCNRSLEGIYEI
jgi:hypothetical protein